MDLHLIKYMTAYLNRRNPFPLQDPSILPTLRTGNRYIGTVAFSTIGKTFNLYYFGPGMLYTKFH